MKKVFVRDLGKFADQASVSLAGWTSPVRNLGGILFVNLYDSTGMVQLVVKKSHSGEDNSLFEKFKGLAPETGVLVSGRVQSRSNSQDLEVVVLEAEVAGEASLTLDPSPRLDFDVFDHKRADHLLKNRHMYLRNPKLMAVLRFRHILMNAIRNWFDTNQFIEIDAPILTPLPLYDPSSALSIEVHDESVFLTQCVGFYLESAVHAFEKIYNMGPSFRGEESRSKRHLMEYWHIKAELAWVNLEEIISTVETLISYTVQVCKNQFGDEMNVLGREMCMDGVKTPYPRITYEEAIRQLQVMGFDIEFGKGLGSSEEEALSKNFNAPFWVVGIPRSIEPFPYVVNKDDPRVTMTADLIATNGYGELLGVAEKIHDINMLKERMSEKGVWDNPKYDWVKDLRRLGCVPHGGFGMGVERLIRWILNIPHVRDAIPFPRAFRRRIFP